MTAPTPVQRRVVLRPNSAEAEKADTAQAWQMICTHCGAAFERARPARYCSAACKQAAYRQRKRRSES